MLRTVVAAQESGMIGHHDAGKITYPLAEMTALVARHNPDQTCWTALAAGTIDFKIPPLDPEMVKGGIKIDPEVGKLMAETIKKDPND